MAKYSSLDDLPDWPGNTPPKNRAGKKPAAELSDKFNGARSKVYRIQGVDREFFSVGELARALSRQPVTIRMWEQRGWIPKVRYRTPAPAGTQIPGKPTKGRRLYSREQVELLIDAVEAFRLNDQKKADWDGFKKHIRANWPAD